MSYVEFFTNEAIEGIKNEVIVMKGVKQTLIIWDDTEGEGIPVIMLDNQTALKVANWILKNEEKVAE